MCCVCVCVCILSVYVTVSVRILCGSLKPCMCIKCDIYMCVCMCVYIDTEYGFSIYFLYYYVWNVYVSSVVYVCAYVTFVCMYVCVYVFIDSELLFYIRVCVVVCSSVVRKTPPLRVIFVHHPSAGPWFKELHNEKLKWLYFKKWSPRFWKFN